MHVLAISFCRSRQIYVHTHIYIYIYIYITQLTLTRLQPDKHLRLVRVCEPTATAAFISCSHSHVLRCSNDVLLGFHRRLLIAMHETNNRSFAAAIFQASMCKFVYPDHPNVKNLFSILAENTRKVSMIFTALVTRAHTSPVFNRLFQSLLKTADNQEALEPVKL
jgi:hypothetical protein